MYSWFIRAFLLDTWKRCWWELWEWTRTVKLWAVKIKQGLKEVKTHRRAKGFSLGTSLHHNALWWTNYITASQFSNLINTSLCTAIFFVTYRLIQYICDEPIYWSKLKWKVEIALCRPFVYWNTGLKPANLADKLSRFYKNQ